MRPPPGVWGTWQLRADRVVEGARPSRVGPLLVLVGVTWSVVRRSWQPLSGAGDRRRRRCARPGGKGGRRPTGPERVRGPAQRELPRPGTRPGSCSAWAARSWSSPLARGGGSGWSSTAPGPRWPVLSSSRAPTGPPTWSAASSSRRRFSPAASGWPLRAQDAADHLGAARAPGRPSPRRRLQSGPDARDAPATCGPDAADRHVEHVGDLLVGDRGSASAAVPATATTVAGSRTACCTRRPRSSASSRSSIGGSSWSGPSNTSRSPSSTYRC